MVKNTYRKFLKILELISTLMPHSGIKATNVVPHSLVPKRRRKPGAAGL